MRKQSLGLVLTVLALCAAGPAMAQLPAVPVVPVVPAKTVKYYDADNNLLPSEAGADHRMETTYRDSVVAMVRVYYASGKLKSVRPYGHMRLGILHGTVTTWYESGTQHTKEDYRAGKRDGELLVYYPEGQVRRREAFAQGVRTEGACFSAEGKPVPFFELRQKPVYPEGAGDDRAIVIAIQKNTEYPREVLRWLPLDARVYLTFTVTKAGKVSNVRTKELTGKSYAPQVFTSYNLLRKECERGARLLKDFTPGQFDGEPVDVSYTVPVSFKVE